ncbi:MAG TPA: hypothetical protein VN176_00305 [Verrucomicrobiae bacterium]|jgi:hypothetical protein|nr:hypothetical protein [Verrucomicrobiae bacterium]
MKTYWKLSALAVLLCLLAALSWGLYQQQTSPAHSLGQMMPEGALVYIEARDFSGLLHDWNGSPEKALWVKSDSYKVFSNSRLFLRLSKASDEFASAAGSPPDMKFLDQAAGKESAIAIYDIGELQFLYVTHLPSRSFVHSPLWLSRNKFQSRSAGGKPFFSRSDADSGRVVAFAVVGDYLILGTKDDLVAGALELYSGSKGHTLAQEGWFSQALAAAPAAPGDLRMVLHMEKVAVTPHFRTYWIQQNITEMRGHSAAVSDLYREGAVYREERVLLPAKKVEDDAVLTQSAQAVTGLLPLVPKDYGFYQASSTDAKSSLAVVEGKILAPHFGAAPVEKLAPQVQLTSGETGSGSDLETRIDVEQTPRVANESAMTGLQKQFDLADPQALLVLQGARKNKDGVLLSIPTVVVVAAAGSWDVAAMQKTVQDSVAPGITASRLGVQWREVKDAGGYYEFDGLYPVQMALRGRLLYFSNNAGLLASVLQTNQAAAAQPVSYAAGFSHSRERQNFYDLATLADQGATGRRASTDSPEHEPQFFSNNVSSFSRAFARLDSEEITTHAMKDKIVQTVIYRWTE